MPLDSKINDGDEQFKPGLGNCPGNPPDRDTWQHISEPVERVLHNLRGVTYGPPPKYDAVMLAEMRRLWEETKKPASEIGLLFGVTKSTVIGQAHRRGWSPRVVFRTRTLDDRMNALHAALDKVLAETFGVGRRPAE